MDRIAVLIVDDHALFREGLVMLLSQETDIHVVGEAADGLQALSLVEILQPDIVLLDVTMPEVGGLEVLHKIRAKCPRTKVLILSGFPEGEFAAEALKRGANGCLSKTLTHKDLVKAIRVTHAGEIWAERRILTEIMENLRQKVHDLHLPLTEMRENLTDREQEVVEWVIQGRTNKEIAAQLGISDKTVKTHLSNVFNKLKVGRRLELLLYRVTNQSD
ncbi:MAG: response regulator transcription factor [candidate division NC10 bacterium]|nr:response regulator transcription factor [candidate division NC10 bacterium]